MKNYVIFSRICCENNCFFLYFHIKNNEENSPVVVLYVVLLIYEFTNRCIFCGFSCILNLVCMAQLLLPQQTQQPIHSKSSQVFCSRTGSID